MSKKKNNKRKKTLVIQTVAPSAKTSAQMTENETNTEKIDNTVVTQEPIDPEEVVSQHYSYVRRDTLKLFGVIGVLAILLVVIYFTNEKTDLLSNFGNWIYKISNITI